MNKENKNEKELSEEKLDRVSGGGNFQPVARDLKYGVGYKPKVDFGRIGYPNPRYTGKKVTDPLPQVNPDMKF